MKYSTKLILSSFPNLKTIKNNLEVAYDLADEQNKKNLSDAIKFLGNKDYRQAANLTRLAGYSLCSQAIEYFSERSK